MAQLPPPGGVQFQLPNGQQPTPQQIQQMQAQLAAEAQKAGLTIPQYIERMKQHMMQQAQMQQQQAQQQGQQGRPQINPNSAAAAQPGQQQNIVPGPPKPEALAVANFLRGQDLKLRTCIFNGERKDMFRVKRAIRALQSDAYVKARRKNALLPEVKDRVTAENTFKLLPMSLLALRVSKIDPSADAGPGHEGHNHAKKKRVKGLWTVKVEPQQEASDDFYYVFRYEGSQWKNKLYAVAALVAILAVVFFPVWPYTLRLGVWYLSMGMLGVLGLFFTMAIFRLILFVVTMFTNAPGLWLFPNLFEDVGFFDSFKPVWAWHEDEKTIKKRKKTERERKKARREAKEKGVPYVDPAVNSKEGIKESEKGSSKDVDIAPAATGAASIDSTRKRNLAASVEEAED